MAVNEKYESLGGVNCSRPYFKLLLNRLANKGAENGFSHPVSCRCLARLMDALRQRWLSNLFFDCKLLLLIVCS